MSLSMVSVSPRRTPPTLDAVPKLWSQTIEAHRRSVHDAILDTAAALAGRHGLRAVTMSRIAEETGIGRATLYKYFSDVEAILHAWHQRQITAHLDQLTAARDQPGDAGERLHAVLEAYALIAHESHQHHHNELAALLHGEDHVAPAQRQLSELIRALLRDAAAAGHVRSDIPPSELTSYCLHALTAARVLPSKIAVRRLVAVTLAGIRPPGAASQSIPR